MPTEPHQHPATSRVLEEIATLARDHGFTVAVAESLTGGKLSEQFSAMPRSAEWFAGSVVCFQKETKFRVLGVPRGPVVTEAAARAMAAGVADLVGADAVASATGIGGPVTEEDQPPGTVWLAVQVRGEQRAELHHFPGEPLEVLAATQERAIVMLRDAMHDAVLS